MAVLAPDCRSPIPMNRRKTSRSRNVKWRRIGTPKIVKTPTDPPVSVWFAMPVLILTFNHKPQRQIGALRYAHYQRAARDIAAILRAGNIHRQCELAGPGRQVLHLPRRGPAPEHAVD